MWGFKMPWLCTIEPSVCSTNEGWKFSVDWRIKGKFSVQLSAVKLKHICEKSFRQCTLLCTACMLCCAGLTCVRLPPVWRVRCLFWLADIQGRRLRVDFNCECMESKCEYTRWSCKILAFEIFTCINLNCLSCMLSRRPLAACTKGGMSPLTDASRVCHW